MRRRWVINPGFQIKYTVSIVLLVGAILGILGYMYVSVLKQERELIGIQRLVTPQVERDAASEEFDRELRREAAKEDLNRVLWLLGLSAILVVGLAFVALKVTHKIAGPVYAVSQTLRAMAMGELDAVRPLRKGDEFRFLYEDLVALRDYISRSAQRSIGVVENTIEVLESLRFEKEADRALIEELVAQLRDFVESQKRIARRYSEDT